MRAMFLLLIVMLLGPLDALRASEGSTPQYRIHQVDAGSDRLEIVDPALPKAATEADRERYLREVLFPMVKSDADAGREPAVWEIGCFYLNGWGVAKDLPKAEAAFRIGLQHKQGHGAWRLGWVFHDKANTLPKGDTAKYLAKAEDLYRAAMAVGFKRAAPQASYLVRYYIRGCPGIKEDWEKAESLLSAIAAVAPTHPRYLLSVALLRAKQKRYDEALEAATRSLPGLKQRAQADKEDGDYEAALALRCVAATHCGKVAELTTEELLDLVNRNCVDYGKGAEPLLQAIGKVAPENPRYLKLMGEWCLNQKRPAEAFDYSWRALPGLKQVAATTGQSDEYDDAKIVAYLSGVESGKIFALKPQELMCLLPKLPPMIGWVLFLGMLPELLGLVFWTCRTRKQGPGLLLSGAWIVVSLLAAGIGFALPLPGLDNPAGHWIGAVLTTLACAVAVWNLGPKRYLGTSRNLPGFQELLRTAGLLVAIIVGVFLLSWGYRGIYFLVSGKPLDRQATALLLLADNPGAFVVTLLVGGIAVPFYEEIIFRGFLFDALLRRWGWAWALGLSSLIFGLVHGLTYAPILFVFGLAFGWLRLRRGNLRLPILLHVLNNSLMIAALYFCAKR